MEIMESISDYTGYVNSGIKLYQELTAFFDKVAFMPFGLGTEIDNGLRQTFCRQYRIIYRVLENKDVEIITIIHSSRLYPRP